MSGKYFSISNTGARSMKYLTRTYTSGICRYEDKYLLLRISDSYKICPGDWEWLTCSVKIDGDSDPVQRFLTNVYHTLKEHTALEAKSLKICPYFVWDDHEFRLTYVLHPIFIEVKKPSVHLANKKFSEYRWVTWDNILNFDRNYYFFDYLNHIRQLY